MSTSKQLREQMILISVDSYENKTIAGRFWFGCLGEEIRFVSLMELILFIEKYREEFEPFSANINCNSFKSPNAAQNNLPELPIMSGERSNEALAVFKLKILFRQNTSWQGLVIWVEGKQEQSFRSVLELIHLLDSALMQTEALKKDKLANKSRSN